jgi:hypothetical protein
MDSGLEEVISRSTSTSAEQPPNPTDPNSTGQTTDRPKMVFAS